MFKTYCIDSLQELEEAWDRRPLSFWDTLMSADPSATFFQSPGWCMEWYRCYDPVFQPLVLAVTRGEQLVGVVPLAVERSTRRLTFASDEMSDYRDVVAMPEHRTLVVTELLRLCRTGKFSRALQLGPMQPASDTLDTARTLSASLASPRMIVRSHASWRWWFTDTAGVKSLTSKKSVRQPLSHYRRQGSVGLERIETREAWEAIRQQFFDQHSLRQMYTDRPVSFNNPRKRAFYDALFRKHPASLHVTALRVGERILAMHFGYTWKGVLYWGAPAFDITEERHSPGQVLLALVFQSAAASGLRGVDLTLGVEEYKKRFSNEHVELRTLEIYPRARRYYARRLRDEAVSLAKASLVKWRGPQALDRVKYHWGFIGRQGDGLRALGARAARRARNAIVTGSKRLIFVAMPDDLMEIPSSVGHGDRYECRSDRVADLLKWEHDDGSTAARIARTVKRVPESWRRGHMLHTMLVNDQLVGWGWSYLPRERVALLDTKTSFELEPNSLWLYDFEIVPKSRHRQPRNAALLARIVRERVAKGVERAYILCAAKDTLGRGAIEQAGFRLLRIDNLTRVLGREKATITQYPSP